MYSIHPINHNIPTFFVYILPSNNGKANNLTTGKLDEISKICKSNGINIIGITSDGDTAMTKFHNNNIMLFETNKFDINNNLLYFSDILHILKRGGYAFVKIIHSKDDRDFKINLFNLPKAVRFLTPSLHIFFILYIWFYNK